MQSDPVADTAADSALLKAKSDALRLLSIRPRSIDELKSHLKLKKYPETAIDEVIRLFQHQGLLNDEKFAKFYAAARVHTRPAGRRQLEFDLKRKGIPNKIVSETISNLEDYDEKKIAKDLVWRRFEKMSGLPKEKKKARLYGFLKRRGFSDDAVFQVINDLFKNED